MNKLLGDIIQKELDYSQFLIDLAIIKIDQLEEEVAKLEEGRTSRFKIPESWLID